MKLVLAVVMLVNSVVSIFYYFAIPRAMLFQPGEDRVTERAPALVTAVVGLAMVAVLAIFFYPDILARAPQFSTLVGRRGLARPVTLRVR